MPDLHHLRNPVCSPVCSLALALSLAAPTGARALELEPCELNLPGTAITAPAECGTLSVPENPDEPDGRQIDLNVARVPANGRTAQPDPLFLFAGGPGQAATEAWLIVAGALKDVNEERDVVLVDQRGTGKSNPLDCPEIEVEEALSSDWDRLEDLTRECLDALDGDPRFYTTTIAMHDYDAVRAALGYEMVNLYGVSYGTRAAQVYLRLFPDRVRSLVLDSVVPQQLPVGVDHALKLDQAVFRVLSACEAEDTCSSYFPDTARQLRELIEMVNQDPVEVAVEHPNTGEQLEFTFDRDALAASLRFLMYSSDSQALVPLLVHEAAETGDFSRMASQMLISTAGITEMLSLGMELSVTCAEDVPFFPEDASEKTGLLMGDSMIRAARVQCGVWPRGTAPGDFHDPVVSDKPALLLSGELDPVTPPEYGDQVASHLSRSRHIVAPGQGHSVTPRGCVGKLIAEFIESADPFAVDAACISNLRPTPFFTSLTGPKP